MLFNNNKRNGVLIISRYIGYVLLDSCLSFEHVELIHFDSHVHSQFRIFIASIYKSHPNTLFHFQTQKFHVAYGLYRYIQHIKLCMQPFMLVYGYVSCYIFLNEGNN